MKKYVEIYTMVLLSMIRTSCLGQNKTDVTANDIIQFEMNLLDTDPYFIESDSITASNGPTSITRNILQDKEGNVWLATWEGIICYDGNSFTNFTNKDELRRYHVFCVLEDRQGSIWFGTIGAGVYRYDVKGFTNITTKDGLANNRVGCLYEDRAGKIWIGTEGGVSCYDGISLRNYTMKDGLCDNDVNSIIEDETGKFWFGTRGDACFYDGNTFTKVTNEEGRPFVNVRCVIEDRKGKIWLGGNDGLWSYDRSTFKNYTTNFVGYIYEDKTGNIWTSSLLPVDAHKWELSRYDVKSLDNEKTMATQILTQEGMFFGILEDKEGGIWLGTLNGVYRYNGKTFNSFKSTEIRE